jgi:hypothetical protein
LLETLDARRFVGRASEQVTEFLREIVDPLLGVQAASVAPEALRV